MIEPFVEQEPVGQAGERVVVGEVIELVLYGAQAGDIGEGHDVIADLARPVVDHAEALPGRKHLAVAAAEQHFSLPELGIPGRQFREIGAAAPARMQESIGLAAQYFLLGVAGDAGEGGIGGGDAAGGVGQEYGFRSGSEDDARLPQAVFGTMALGHVLEDADHPLLGVRSPLSPQAGFEKVEVAGCSGCAEFDPDRFPARLGALQGLDDQIPILGFQSGEKDVGRLVQGHRQIADQGREMTLTVQ